MSEIETERKWVNQWVKSAPLETRSAPKGKKDTAPLTVGGYAAVFEKRSQPLGGFVEIVERSCFNKSQADGWPGVVCRYNHNDMALLGTTAANTLRLRQDDNGLDYEVDLPQCRSDVGEYVQRGDITNSSFAFVVYDQDWTQDGDGYPVRHLLSARLIDTAPVTIPAYPDATAGLRSLASRIDAPIDDVIHLARDNELRRMFKRSDKADTNRPLTAWEAKRILTEMRYPKPTLTGSQAKAVLTDMYLPTEGIA